MTSRATFIPRLGYAPQEKSSALTLGVNLSSLTLTVSFACVVFVFPSPLTPLSQSNTPSLTAPKTIHRELHLLHLPPSIALPASFLRPSLDAHPAAHAPRRTREANRNARVARTRLPRAPRLFQHGDVVRESSEKGEGGAMRGVDSVRGGGGESRGRGRGRGRGG